MIGGHLNPAISLMMFTFGRLSFIRFIVYTLAQTAGAFVGAAMSFLVYYGIILCRIIKIFSFIINEILSIQMQSIITMAVFVQWSAIQVQHSSFHHFHKTMWVSVRHCSIRWYHFSLTDFNSDLRLLALVFSVSFSQSWSIVMCLRGCIRCTLVCCWWWSELHSVSTSVIRSIQREISVHDCSHISPVMVSKYLGFGIVILIKHTFDTIFSYNNYRWFWIPIIGPFIGAVLGAWIYYLFIGFHIPNDVVETNDYQPMIPNKSRANGCRQMETIHLDEKMSSSD